MIGVKLGISFFVVVETISFARSNAKLMWLHIFSLPSRSSNLAFNNTISTAGKTPESTTCMPCSSDCSHITERLCKPVESMKGTLRIRIMRTLALNIIFIILEYNLSSLRFFLLMLFNKMLCNEVEDSYCHNSEDNVLDVSVVFFYFGSKLAFWNDRMKIPTEGS